MNPDDLARILDELGRRLGPAGQHVFELAVRQAYIEAFAGTVFLIVSIVVTSVIAIVGYRWVQGGDTYNDRGFPVGIAVGISALVTALAFANFIAYDLPRFLNPEYAAIRDILSAVGGK